MTGPDLRLEDRLARALRAEAGDVRPAPDSLERIRSRVRSARRRRRTVAAGATIAAMAALVVAVPAFDGPGGDDVTTGPAASPTVEAPDARVAPAPEAAFERAMWPDPAGDEFDDPVAAARLFVEVVVGVDDPPLSELRQVGPGEGEIDVYRRGEDGRLLDQVASTVEVGALDGTHWYVTSARSDDVQIAWPEPLGTASPPARIAGHGHGYEGTIVVGLWSRAPTPEILDEGVATGGAGEALEPFGTELSFAPDTDIGVLVARDDPGAERSVPSFAAHPVRLVASPSGPTPETADPGGPPAPEAAEYEFGSRPLWPFRTKPEADAWLAVSGDGHSPWHASAEATAFHFTNDYLGFTEIDQVTLTEIGDAEAWIGVGYRTEGGEPATVAVIHLLRFGAETGAPWEVVGTRDSTLTIDTPVYGEDVGTTAVVGGRSTGVDGSIHVQVRQPSSSPEPIGDSCCVAADGGARWETTVAVAGATDPGITVVAWSGEREVEVFAVTGVRPPPGPE